MNIEDPIPLPPGFDEAINSIGAIDMGSKNFKFVFGQKINGIITTELIGKERLELGKEVTENDGLIGEEKIAQMQETLSRFVSYCRDRGATEILAIATSAIRNAKNHQRIIDMARETGLTIDVAEGIREGRLGYLAATGGESNKLVSDGGSKSMQIAWEFMGKIHSHSVPVGYELAYEGFLETASTFNEAETNVPQIPCWKLHRTTGEHESVRCLGRKYHRFFRKRGGKADTPQKTYESRPKWQIV